MEWYYERSGTEELNILAVAELVAQKMGVRNFHPRSVSWMDRLPTKLKEIVHSDELVFYGDKIVLANRMSGVLKGEEWAPMIASTLAYDWTLRGTRVRHSAKWLLVVAVAAFVLSFAAVYVLGFPAPFPYITAVVFGILILLFSGAIVWLFDAPYRMRIRLRADTIAADFTGVEGFLKSLTKIDSAGLEDIENSKGDSLWSRFSDRPTITQRIENIRP